MAALRGKLKIEAVIKVLTGLHIGASSEFAPIGAVHLPFIRDVFSKQPIIPGSSLKGKLRTLLARSESGSYILHDIKNDSALIKRNFGSTDKNSSTRMQFCDSFITEESKRIFGNRNLDTYIGEIKFENVIQRNSGQANPRQIERVPAGVEFSFQMTYNVENPDEVAEDMKLLAKAIAILEMDYLGGHGSRGYGRVAFDCFKVTSYVLNPEGMSDFGEKAGEFCNILENRLQSLSE